MRVTILVRTVISAVLLVAARVHPAFAQCTFSGGDGSGGIVTFQLPAVFMLDPDTLWGP
jgi:hypothetical protein